MWTETHVPDHKSKSIDSDLIKTQTKCLAEDVSDAGTGRGHPTGLAQLCWLTYTKGDVAQRWEHCVTQLDEQSERENREKNKK